VRREIPKRVGSKHKAVAWCLEIHGLILSKCAAGRERDWLYAKEAVMAGLVDVELLFVRIADLPVDAGARKHVEKMLRALTNSLATEGPASD
jgi:hypothetical protein